MKKMQENVSNIVKTLLNEYQNQNMTLNDFKLPLKNSVIEILDKLLEILYPLYFKNKDSKFFNLQSHLSALIEDTLYCLSRQISLALAFLPEYQDKLKAKKAAEEMAVEFFKKLVKIQEFLKEDLQAAYSGDPAAHHIEEIVLSYPGMYAISINRIAHELFLLGVPLIPRMMTEHAHWQTGIDIHPGASIGRHFFIDHGSGVVIGETTMIGDHVKIYQGVTLGALSTKGGQKLKGKKRHPSIENHVTIYSGACVLGGETVIGEGCVIGSNAFITKSIEPHTRVSIKNQELIFTKGNNVVKKALEQDDLWR